MSASYEGAEMRGMFLVDLSRPGDDMAYCHAIEADNLAHLDYLAAEYAARHGFTVEGATFAGQRVPGIGGAR